MSQARTEPEQLLREWVDITNEQDYSKIPDVVAESFIWETPGAPGGEVRGPDEAKGFIDEVTNGFPDFEVEIIDVLTSDDKGMAELRFTMTHEGEFKDIPPTGREIELRAMSTCRVADGQLQELRDYANMQVLFDQLGVTEVEAPQEEGQPTSPPTTEENERLAREHFDQVWNQGEVDTDVLADDYRMHLHLGDHETLTLAEFEGLIEQAREAVPDLRKEPDDVIATDEKVTIRYTATGTQEGEFKEVPSTGEEFEIGAVAIYQVENGTITEEWLVADWVRALKQQGLID